MARGPKNRKEFKDYCLRRLGAPVIEINVAPEQVEDRIEDAIRYFVDYHFDGTKQIYFKYQVTANDIQNKYITLPENVIGAVDIFPIGQALNTNNLFNIRYQIALNDLYTLTSVSMVPYYMALQHIQFLEMLLVGKQPLRYNRLDNRLHIDMDWNIVNVGDFLLVQAYEVVDPDEWNKMWSEWWLQRYATCLIKEQWGSNIKKFANMPLPGGIKLNGKEIYNEAVAEKAKLEHEMIYSFSLPVTDMIG
jgi:hypothetical protein